MPPFHSTNEDIRFVFEQHARQMAEAFVRLQIVQLDRARPEHSWNNELVFRHIPRSADRVYCKILDPCRALGVSPLNVNTIGGLGIPRLIELPESPCDVTIVNLWSSRPRFILAEDYPSYSMTFWRKEGPQAALCHPHLNFVYMRNPEDLRILSPMFR